MDQSTLPTRQSVRIKLQRITPVRRREIEERGKWSIFTSLDLLPQPKRRRVGRHANDDAADDVAADDAAAAVDADAIYGKGRPRITAKVIGASLEAAPVVHVADTAILAALRSVDFADLCITFGA